ncbi:MAG: type 1 glutamine amidotransferase domain-containing protein [Opitutales bacterium]
MALLDGKQILMFVGDIYEDLELWYPKLRLEEAGATVVVAGESDTADYVGKHGYPCRADCRIDGLSADDFDALVIPGGFMPDKLRRNDTVLELTRAFDRAGKVIGMICHAGWIPISAGILKGRTVTSTPGIRDDLVNAGATWVDEALVVDGHIVSSRRPPDLPAFGRALVEAIGRASTDR